MHRRLVFACSLVACVEVDKTGTSTAPETTGGAPLDTSSMTPGTSTTISPTSSASDSTAGASTTTTTTEAPPPIHGEWLGTYTTGFGFVRFQACDDPDGWALADASLPYFNECTQAPLWLRVQGTVTVDGNSAYLAVTSILSGPCALGSCDAATPLDGCASFDELCAP